jgi:hypothetical protein
VQLSLFDPAYDDFSIGFDTGLAFGRIFIIVHTPSGPEVSSSATY